MSHTSHTPTNSSLLPGPARSQCRGPEVGCISAHNKERKEENVWTLDKHLPTKPTFQHVKNTSCSVHNRTTLTQFWHRKLKTNRIVPKKRKNFTQKFHSKILRDSGNISNHFANKEWFNCDEVVISTCFVCLLANEQTAFKRKDGISLSPVSQGSV